MLATSCPANTRYDCCTPLPSLYSPIFRVTIALESPGLSSLSLPGVKTISNLLIQSHTICTVLFDPSAVCLKRINK